MLSKIRQGFDGTSKFSVLLCWPDIIIYQYVSKIILFDLFAEEADHVGDKDDGPSDVPGLDTLSYSPQFKFKKLQEMAVSAPRQYQCKSLIKANRLFHPVRGDSITTIKTVSIFPLHFSVNVAKKHCCVYGL